MNQEKVYLADIAGYQEEKEEGENIPLTEKSLTELKEMAKEKEIKGYSKMNKQELIDSLENDKKEEE